MPTTAAQLVVRIGADITSAQRGLDSMDARLLRTQRFSSSMGATFLTVGGLMAAGVGLGVKAAGDFEATLSGVGAVSGATRAQLEGLRTSALAMGRDTVFSANEAAQGMEELAKGGVSIPDIMNGAAKATLSLAAAGGVSLPEAATIAANAMNTFGLSGKDMAHVADLVAGAANASSIDVSDFGLSMAQSGAVARSSGVNIDDLAVSIAVLGQEGLKGSDAGTSMRTMFLRLNPITKQARDEMEQLGIITADGANRFFDATGKLKSMAEVSQVLQDATKNLTDAQRTQALEVIFGTDSVRAATIFAREGASGFTEMAASMDKVTAAQVAAARLDNLNGSLRQLKSSLENDAIGLGTQLIPALRSAADAAKVAADAFAALPEGTQKAIAIGTAGFAGLALTVGATTLAAGALAGAVKNVTDLLGKKQAAKEGVTAANKALQGSMAGTGTAAEGLAGKIAPFVGTAGLFGLLAAGAIGGGEAIRAATANLRESGSTWDEIKLKAIEAATGPAGAWANFMDAIDNARARTDALDAAWASLRTTLAGIHLPDLSKIPGFSAVVQPKTASPFLGVVGKQATSDFGGLFGKAAPVAPMISEDAAKRYTDFLDQEAAGTKAVAQMQTDGAKAAADAMNQQNTMMAQQRDQLVSLLGGTQAWVDSLVSADPAAQGAAQAVDTLTGRVAGLQAAQEANNAATAAAQTVLQGMQDHVSALSDQLNAAKQSLQDFANVKLVGMGAEDQKEFDLTQKINANRLEQLKLEQQIAAEQGKAVVRTPGITVGVPGAKAKSPAEQRLDAAKAAGDALQNQLEQAKLAAGLKFDPQLRKLQEDAKGTAKELTLSEAEKGIKAAKDQIGNLEGQLKSAKDAAKAQEDRIKALEDAGKGYASQLRDTQQQLQTTQDHQDKLNKVLADTYQFLFVNEAEMRKQGPAGQAAADAIEKAASATLDSVKGLADQTTTESNKALDALDKHFAQVQAEQAAILLNLKKMTATPEGLASEYGGLGGGTPPGRAGGGPVRRGNLYLVGENGPEPFIPSSDGMILPHSALAGAGGGTGGGNGDRVLTINGPLIHVASVTNETNVERIADAIMDRLEREWEAARGQDTRRPSGLARMA